MVTCPVLPAPTNGGVSNPSLNYQGVATYSCDTGFVLAGSATRQCRATGQWSGVAPTCPRELANIGGSIWSPYDCFEQCVLVYECLYALTLTLEVLWSIYGFIYMLLWLAG